MRVLLFIKSLLCLRLITLPPLEKRGNGIFLKNQDLNIKLEKVTESNIMDMYVVVHNRKIFFYNKGSYHGFGYDEDNVSLKLNPISLGKINYFSQDNDDQRLRIVRWGDLIKKSKSGSNEANPISKSFKSDISHENTDYPEIIIKTHAPAKSGDNENTERKVRTISSKHVLEEENSPRIEQGIEIIGGYSDYDLNKKKYDDGKYERTPRYTKSKIGSCLFSEKNCEWVKDDYNKRHDDRQTKTDEYGSILRNLGEMLKNYQGPKPDQTKKPERKEEVYKKPLKEDIQSDSEMLDVKTLDISISTVDKKNKTFVLKNKNNLCVTYYQGMFIMTACTNSKKQIFKLVNAEDVAKKLSPKKEKQDSPENKEKADSNGTKDDTELSGEADRINVPDPKDEADDNAKKEKKEEPKKTKKKNQKKRPKNKKSKKGRKKGKKKSESSEKEEDTSSSESEESESKEKEPPKKNKKKKKHRSKKTPDESAFQKQPQPEFEDSKSNYNPNYAPRQFNRPNQMNNQPPRRLEEYCRDLYNKAYGQINKLPPECRNLYGFRGPVNPVSLKTTIKVPIKTPGKPNLKIKVPQKFIQKSQPEPKSEVDNINSKTPEQQNNNLIAKLEKALGTDSFFG